MMSLGNEVGNSVWEAHTRGQTKPNPRSSREDKERWIRAKYEAKEFIAMPQSGIPLNEQVRLGCSVGKLGEEERNAFCRESELEWRIFS